MKQSFLYGVVGGLLQGIFISTCVGILRSRWPSLTTAPAILLVLHPVLITPTMAGVTIAMIIQIQISKDEIRDVDVVPSSSSSSPLAVYRDFQTSIVAICLFFVLSQVTNFVYFVLRGLKSDSQYVAFFYCSLFTMINSAGNFFIYVVTSKKFRRALRRFFRRCVAIERWVMIYRYSYCYFDGSLCCNEGDKEVVGVVGEERGDTVVMRVDPFTSTSEVTATTGL